MTRRSHSKTRYVSDRWWRAPLFASLTAQMVLLVTDAERTTVGHIIQVVLFAVALTAIVTSGGVGWILSRRRGKAAEHEPREGINP